MTGARVHDFDLHGLVGVRLLDAEPADVARVTRQLGPVHHDLDREPDVVVRFVDEATTRPVTHVGLGDTGFNEDGFFVLRGKDGIPARARIPFADIGRQPEIVCERAMPAVPHLLAIVNLTALAHGVLPLHASAFTVDGVGVLVTGWAKSGKTESLLAAVRAGGEYVGDEWIYLTPDGDMSGVPEPIRLWAWHLDQRPEVLARQPARDRGRLTAWRGLAGLVARGAGSHLPGAGVARKAAPVVARQAYLQVPPAELFGADRVALRGHLDAAVLVLSHDAPEIVSRSAAAREISGRMAASLLDERSPLMAHYRQFRYAFPGQTSHAVENAARREARLLAEIFDARPAAVVAHPYPCDIDALGREVVRVARGLAQPAPARPEGAAS